MFKPGRERIPDQVWPLEVPARTHISIVEIDSYVVRTPCFKGCNTRDLPAADHLSGKAMHALAERQHPDVAAVEDVPLIEIGEPQIATDTTVILW